MCVFRVSGCVCSGWPSLYSFLSVVKCVCMCFDVGGWGGVLSCVACGEVFSM